MKIETAARDIGTVDLQVNGITVPAKDGGDPVIVDFSMAGLKFEHVRDAVQAWHDKGVSYIVPTIITAPAKIMLQNAETIARAMGEEWGQGILGIHFEGPFLSLKTKGAHPANAIREPDIGLFDSMFERANGKVAWTTISPAHEKAAEFIRHVAGLGVVVSVGHHVASTEQLEHAFEAGATGVTHAGNAWDRDGWNAKSTQVLAQLLSDGVYAMGIADGEHVPRDFLKYVAKARGPEHFILVSDASPAAFAPKGRYIVFNGLDIIVTDSKVPGELKTDPLSGSYQGLPRCMDFIHQWGIIAQEDILKAVWENPLRFLKPALDRLGLEKRVVQSPLRSGVRLENERFRPFSKAG